MASIGSLIGMLGLDTARFQSGIKKAQTGIRKFRMFATRQLKRIQRSFDNLTKRLFQYGAALITIAGPAIMGIYIRESFKMIDAQAKLADTLGMSTKSLVGFELAAKRTGATVEQVKKSIEKMAINAEDAARGIGTAKDAFDTMGINAKKFIELPIDEMLLALSDQIRTMRNETIKMGVTYDLFGRQGTNMIKMLNLGSKTLKLFIERAVNLNIAVARMDAAKVERANDAWMEANEAIKGVSNTIAVALAPLIEKVSNMFVDAAMKGKGFSKEVAESLNWIVAAVGNVLDAWRFMEIGWKTLTVGVLASTAVVIKAFELLARVNPLTAIPFALSGLSKEIDHFFKAYVEGATEAAQALSKLIAEPMPSKGLKKWVEEVQEAAKDVKSVFDEIKVTAEPNIWTTMLWDINQLGIAFDNVFMNIDKGLTSMKDTFINNLRKMVRELLASKLMDLFFPGLVTGGFGGIVKKLFGAQHGADFVVGGRGGTDSNVVAFRATRGERVTVTPLGQSQVGGGGFVFHNTYDFRGSSLNEAQVRQMIVQGNQALEADIKLKIRKRRF